MSVLEIIAILVLFITLGLMVIATRRAAAHRREEHDVYSGSSWTTDGDGGGD